jgi:hypothetical protein
LGDVHHTDVTDRAFWKLIKFFFGLAVTPDDELLMRRRIADLVSLTHIAVIIVVLFGWIYPDRSWLTGYVIGMGLMLFQWRIFHNQCVLTMIEDWLRQESTKKIPAERHSFIARTVESVFGPRLSERGVNVISHVVVFICALIATVRIINRGYYN